MIKKLFVYNQFILAFILIGLFIFPKFFSYKKSNEYLVRQINSSYKIYFVNNTYIISDFTGSGGWLYGGIISANKIPDINKLSKKEIDQIIENDLDYIFSSKSFPDNGLLYIQNFDSDKNIEICAFELLGTSLLHPIEINKNGEIREENIFTCALIYFLASFWMLPNFIFCIIFFLYYFIICILFLKLQYNN
ncbi:MAG: hypothetical protein IKQ13_04495 [Treponema sp.]|nr:hypothetical protein [Treponema sp.]